VSAAAFLLAGNAAHAASDSFEGGGVLQDGFDALQQKLTRSGDRASQPRLRVLDQKSPAVGFTPRFAGVPIALAEGVSIDRGSLLKSRLAGASASQNTQSRALQLAQTHDLGLVKIDLSAIAGFSEPGDQDYGQSSTFGLGGGLMFESLGGLRLDAFYSRRDEQLGLARDSVTAGLGYDFGAVGTRLSVSNVSQYDINGIAADEQNVWSLGGQMKLSSSLIVGGDLAYSTSLVDGTEDTSGVVNFRFNF
jgi:hypothetical protein